MTQPIRQAVRVHFKNGDYFETEINGTTATITEYYAIGKEFNLGREGDNIQQVTKLEFIS